MKKAKKFKLWCNLFHSHYGNGDYWHCKKCNVKVEKTLMEKFLGKTDLSPK